MPKFGQLRVDCRLAYEYNLRVAFVNPLFTRRFQTCMCRRCGARQYSGLEDQAVSNKQEINHLLLMAKLLASQQDDGTLSYFISMAIEQNRQTPRKVSKADQAA